MSRSLAALLFDLRPNRAIVGDTNPYLINAYSQLSRNSFKVKDFWDRLEKAIFEHDKNGTAKEYYLKIRDRYNECVMLGRRTYKHCNEEYDALLAAMFIFLNKNCYNGLYRVNKNNYFNVPYGGKPRKLLNNDSEDNLRLYLSEHVLIDCRDFEKTCETASKGDFVFFDSPYDLLNNQSFDKYTKDGFSREDHSRLAKLYKKLDQKGCYLMLTNHNTKFINDLYKDYNIKTVPVKRAINSDASKRTGEEIIITNYAKGDCI